MEYAWYEIGSGACDSEFENSGLGNSEPESPGLENSGLEESARNHK